MKITLVVEKDKNVGVRTYADNLGKALRDKGHRIRNFQHWKRDFWVAGRNLGAVAYPIASRFRKYPEADVTHATFSNLTSAKCQVTTVMDLVFLREKGYPEARILNRLYKKSMQSGVVVCPTQFVADQVEEWLGPDSQAFVTALAPDPIFQPSDYVTRCSNVVLAVGDANPRKRTLESVRAMEGVKGALLQHVGRPWTGTEYGRLCVEEAKKRGVRFQEAGAVSREKLAYFYQLATVLLYPSTDEGFGLPPLEAAACGLTSIVGSHPVFDEVMGKDCISCDGTQPDAIRAAIDHVLRFPLPGANLRARAGKYSWARCADETLRAYEAAV